MSLTMKHVIFSISIVCCVSLITMASVMFVMYAQLQGEFHQFQAEFHQLQDEFHQLQHQNSFFSSELNKSNKMIAQLKIELTSLNETQQVLKNPRGNGQSCQQLLTSGYTLNGVYTITGTGTPFEAYCQQEEGGYMVFQRRFDGSTDFNQIFQTYVNGFGNVSGEFWLGLETLHQFTKIGKHQLRVDLVAYDGDTAYAIYEDFSVGAGPGYRLHIGNYSGTAGDSLTYHNNLNFSTPQNDQDAASRRNCAHEFQGAFWYNNCHHVNLMNFNYHDTTNSKGMRWLGFNYGNPVKTSTMMVL